MKILGINLARDVESHGFFGCILLGMYLKLFREFLLAQLVKQRVTYMKEAPVVTGSVADMPILCLPSRDRSKQLI